VSAPVRTAEDIERWLVDQIAQRTGLPAASVDPGAPFATYHLDSMEGVNMAGALEDLVGLELEPTLVWDYPTVEKLARHIAELLGAAPPSAKGA
jgi:phthiocerol/phenolphthiocerol synthesis type-I polyketide synthase D